MEPQPIPETSLEPTNNKRPVWQTFGIATLLGLLGSFFFEGAWSLNIALWITLLIASVWWLLKSHQRPNTFWWCFVLACVFAWLLVWRDSSVLKLLNTTAMISALGIGLVYTTRGLEKPGFLVLMWGWLIAFLHALGSWIGFFTEDVSWKETRLRYDAQRHQPYLRGFGIMVVLLVFFGALLGSADTAFGVLMSRVFQFNIDQGFWWWLVRFAFCLVFAIDCLRLAVKGSAPPRVPESFSLGGVETVMALGGLNVLFAAFIVVQIKYIFGGEAQIQALTGLTYAEYARQGFFELLRVVLLAFPILILALHANHQIGTKRATKRLSLVTLGLLFLMLVSAWQRTQLYASAYGLTEIRFYTSALLIWLACMLVYYALTALQNQYANFVMGAFCGGFVAVFVLNVVNPNAIIVEHNLARVAEFDVQYAVRLGADAVPSLLEKSPPELENTIKVALTAQWKYTLPNNDWRAFHISKTLAKQLLER